VPLPALKAANPTVQPTKMKPGQKLVIPPGSKTTADTATTGAVPAADAGGQTYTVKSGDTLGKIAKKFGVKEPALQAASGLTTTKIIVGHKLKIPAKTEAPATAPATAPAAPTDTLSAPVPATPPPAMPAAPVPSLPAAPAHN
jgi:LysM repeat protein